MTGLANPKLLRREDVEAILSVSRTTLWAWLKIGHKHYNENFPQPINCGGNVVRWDADEILKFIEICKTQRNKKE